MSGPWQTPPAGSDLPPRNGNVQYYASRQIFPRNTITGADWKVGREAVFQFESDPASGWLVPDQCKLYMRFKIKTKSGANVPDTSSLRFAGRRARAEAGEQVKRITIRFRAALRSARMPVLRLDLKTRRPLGKRFIGRKPDSRESHLPRTRSDDDIYYRR